MDNDTLEKILKQHEDNYRKALLETIRNNTNALVDDDIMSLIRKPPLDSMDLIQAKILDLAKKNNIILNTDVLQKSLVDFRKDLAKCCLEIKNIRIKELSSVVEKYQLDSKNVTITLYKKDFNSLNKKIKNILKDRYIACCEKLFKKINNFFSNDIDIKIQDKIFSEFIKYMKTSFQRQLLENFDIKVLVKDTTLINSTKEQSERYLFTLNNSRLLNNLE